MRASSVLTLTGATLVTGFLGYAVYFDYKRRNDPAFRSQLKKDRKRTSKELKKQGEKKKREVDDAVERTVHELNQPGALPTGVGEKEEVFMQSVQEGEMLLLRGPEFYIAAATAFFKALKVYPKPYELLLIYQKAVPEEALNYIHEMVGKDAAIAGDPSTSSFAGLAKASASVPTGSALEEVDDETPASTAAVGTSSSPPSAPMSSQGGESGSTNNGDASSIEWEKVSQHEGEEKKVDEVASASDAQLNRVGEEALKDAQQSQTATKEINIASTTTET